jgi:hypothetical protein
MVWVLCMYEINCVFHFSRDLECLCSEVWRKIYKSGTLLFRARGLYTVIACMGKKHFWCDLICFLIKWLKVIPFLQWRRRACKLPKEMVVNVTSERLTRKIISVLMLNLSVQMCVFFWRKEKNFKFLKQLSR